MSSEHPGVIDRRRRADSAPAAPRPALGLVCLTVSGEVRYRTVTRTRLLAHTSRGRRAALLDLYAANVERLEAAVDFCEARGIFLYRIPSGLLPFSDHPFGEPLLPGLRAGLARIGRRSRRLGLRLVIHPDQFVVLSSESPAVVENSIRMLEGQAMLLDLLGQPRSPWAAIELHGGKRGRAAELIRAVRSLPRAVRSRLVLENDERAYGAAEILEVCRAARVPMVFDAHHHLVHGRLPGYDHPSMAFYLRAAAATWPRPEWQLVHISNGRAGLHDPSHSDLIERMPASYRRAPWIEVEAKGKEEAIERLRRPGPGRG